MWLQRFTNYILRHRWQAVALAFVSTFIPVLGILGILIAALVTLCKGVVEGAILCVAATLPYFISFYVSGSHDTTVPLVVIAAVGVAVLSNVLTWVFAVMLRKHATWTTILQVAALLGVLAISVVHLIYPGVSDWWGNELQSYYTQAKNATGFLTSGTPGATDIQLETINVTKTYATGLMVAAILFNAVLQLIVARWWQAIVFKPGSLRRELHGIRLSQLAGILFVISLVFYYLGNSVVLDIMPVLFMLFGTAGLSVIHYFFGLLRSPSVWFWLSVLYVTLILSFPMSLFLVSFIALLDIWFDVRKRVKRV